MSIIIPIIPMQRRRRHLENEIGCIGHHVLARRRRISLCRSIGIRQSTVEREGREKRRVVC